MHCIWRGTIAFGLVSVPVGLHSAIGREPVRMHQYDRETKERIRQVNVTEGGRVPVERADIVKGYDADGGPIVYLDEADLVSCQPDRNNRNVEVRAFVHLDEIDPIYIDGSYYVSPGKGAGKGYALLAAALAATGRVGIVEWSMRDRPYLGALRASEGRLILHTLNYSDQVRENETFVPDDFDLSAAELDMAEQLVETLAGKWYPEDYRNNYSARVLELIADKRREMAQEPDEIDVMKECDDLLAELEGMVA